MTKLKITASTVASPAVELFAEERKRQITEEGFSLASDIAMNMDGELARAAACYAMSPDAREWDLCSDIGTVLYNMWPWKKEQWKPSISDRKREIVKAGGLLIAEWDRLDAVEQLNKENK